MNILAFVVPTVYALTTQFCESSHRQYKMNEHGYVPIELYKWTMKFNMSLYISYNFHGP